MTWLRNGLDYRHLGFWSISPISFQLRHLKGSIKFKKVIWGTFRETGLSFVLNRAYLWSVFRHTHTPWPLRWHAISKVALQLPWWYEWINHMNPTWTRIVLTTTKPKEMIQNRAYLLWDVLVHMDVVVYSKAQCILQIRQYVDIVWNTFALVKLDNVACICVCLCVYSAGQGKDPAYGKRK